LEAELPDLESGAQAARTIVATTQNEANSALARLAELQGQVASFQTERDRLKPRRDELALAIQSAEAAASAAEENLRELRAEQGQLNALVEALRTKRKTLSSQVADQEAELATMEDRIRVAQRRAEALEANDPTNSQENEGRSEKGEVSGETK
jgi:chromosome segregation ATPase